MSSHKLKHCPRCNSLFECSTGTILNCQCKTVHLNPEQLDYIARHYNDCLCAQCLISLTHELAQIEPDLTDIENT